MMIMITAITIIVTTAYNYQVLDRISRIKKEEVVEKKFDLVVMAMR